MTTALLGYQVLSLTDLHESKRNPRKHFNAEALAELAESIRTKGVLTPLLVRPNAAGYEIAAGHRRYRAAKTAGVGEVPAIVREMTDTEFLEILTIENLQREDVHPLEEAEGYRQLLDAGGYDVARIAERVGKSVKYVYDRMKLLGLTKAAQALSFDGKITAGHAILLARLTPKDQARVIGTAERGYADGGLFTREQLLWDPERDTRLVSVLAGEKDPGKPISVRELQAWIDKHVRFQAAAADPMLFPETVGAVTAAKEQAEKIVPITHEHYIDPAAREGRTFGPRSWKRADGTGKHKRCEHAVTGVVVIGPGRSEAFKVCIAKEKCATHWGAEQKERKARAAGAAKQGKSGEQRWEIEQRKQREQHARDEAELARWKKAAPAILEALAERVKKAPAKATGLLAQIVLGQLQEDPWNMPKGAASTTSFVPLGTTAEDLVRHAAFKVLRGECYEYQAPREFLKRAKAFGVDVKKIVDAVAPPVQTSAVEESGSAAKKKGTTKKKAKK